MRFWRAVSRTTRAALAAAALAVLAGCASSGGQVKRIAVISAFYGELEVLLAQVETPRMRVINGKTFTTGTLAGKPVVLFLSGVSMVNAALSAQLALDHFP
ncbi:MAG: phosphorylase, partial [Gammaproteobacteria bacterium]|nr:phosphorylase [Gammaproteobacteria bacterium]